MCTYSSIAYTYCIPSLQGGVPSEDGYAQAASVKGSTTYASTKRTSAPVTTTTTTTSSTKPSSSHSTTASNGSQPAASCNSKTVGDIKVCV